ncbi:hypothetical protein GQ457_14G016410 [Hibiscus cannabinus]
MFDLAINTTLDPKTLELPPTLEENKELSHIPIPKGVVRFCLYPGRSFWDFCSQVYSGELSRGREEIFVEAKDSRRSRVHEKNCC